MTEISSLDSMNPFAAESTLPYGLPDFSQIQVEHYLPAIRAGMATEIAEIEAIAGQKEAPTVENTLVAMENAGTLLHRVLNVFFAVSAVDATDEIQQIETEIAPLLSAHEDSIVMNRQLFSRIEAFHLRRDELELDQATAWLLDQMYREFVRSGALLGEQEQTALRNLNESISKAETRFQQLLTAETNASAVFYGSIDDMIGAGEESVVAARLAAQQEGKSGYLIGLHNTTQQPILGQLFKKTVRERIYASSMSRGTHGGDFDTRATILELISLRAKRARMLGFAHHSAYVADEGTAHTTEAVMDMMTGLVPSAVANARDEEAELIGLLHAEHDTETLSGADWFYYTEQVRKERYDLDDQILRPFFELERVLHDGVFLAANRLYGVEFTERTELTGHHPDARVFEVTEADGTGLGLYVADFYARPTKEGGAWMNNLVDQSTLLGTSPVVTNNFNFTPHQPGEPTLLTLDEVVTLFHEFGHALHGLFSDVVYPSRSGTNVPRDFVEYPSQVNEMWAFDDDVITHYARHVETNEPLPDELVRKLTESRTFNQGQATVEYLAAVLLDQAWHQLTPEQVPLDVVEFERDALMQAQVWMESVPPRYRSGYFAHIFSSSYAASYYSYIWAEVLDADTGEWFDEFDGTVREAGERFRRELLARGGSVDPLSAYRAFRGRDPHHAPLLRRRGLAANRAWGDHQPHETDSNIP